MKKLMVTLLVVGMAVVSIGGLAWAKMTVKCGHVAPPFHGQNRGIEAFAQYVNDKTAGAIEIQNFPSSQLGGETSLADQVQSGTLEMATVSVAVLQNYVPQVAVTDLPFVFPDLKTAYAVIDDPEVQEKIFSYLPAKGFVGVGWTENGLRDITNSKRDIRKPEDLKGLKIRVMTSPIYIDTFKQLGASPTDLPFPEIYSALQNGTIDAQENPLMTSVLIKATEVTKHATMTGHILTECIIIVNADVWKKLTPEQQKIFREAGAIAIKVNREVNAQLSQKLPKSDLSVAEFCKQNDVKVTALTKEEREAFKAATKPVWDKYRPFIGPDLFDFFITKVKSHSPKE
jgi:TRAP-type transport system periplasmic protein